MRTQVKRHTHSHATLDYNINVTLVCLSNRYKQDCWESFYLGVFIIIMKRRMIKLDSTSFFSLSSVFFFLSTIKNSTNKTLKCYWNVNEQTISMLLLNDNDSVSSYAHCVFIQQFLSLFKKCILALFFWGGYFWLCTSLFKAAIASRCRFWSF